MTDRPPAFNSDFKDQLATLVRWRRDVRHFRTDALPEGLLERLIHQACASPSVGLSQPWRFVVVRDPQARQRVRANFAEANADALRGYDGDKAQAYASLKLAGLDDAPEHLAILADESTELGFGLGRRTMPETIAYSVVGAIATFWLLARAEGVGVGWISILDAHRMSADLTLEPQWRFIAYLCIGYPQVESDTPELERVEWERRLPPESFISYR